MPITAAKKITAGSFIFLTYMSTSKLPGAMSKTRYFILKLYRKFKSLNLQSFENCL